MGTTVSVESMTPDEMQALSLGQLGLALNELMAALAECGRSLISARYAIAKVRIEWRREPATFDGGKDEYEAQLEEARAAFDCLKIRSQSLKELKSTLQTIVRAIP